MAEVMARSRRYAGPSSRWNMGIIRQGLSLEGWAILAGGAQVPMKFATQSRGPPGAMPEGSSYRVGCESMLWRCGMPIRMSLIKQYLGMPGTAFR